MIKEFKQFIKRGNVLDLAVGVIIGAAFSAIVTSLVNNILTPIIGIVFGGVDFSGLKLVVGDETILYGEFIQSIFNFLATAVCLFIIVKFMNKIEGDLNKISKRNKKEEVKEVKEVPKKSDDILLLEEIRDLLKDNKKERKSKK